MSTPRTDEWEKLWDNEAGTIWADFARQLETELAAANADADLHRTRLIGLLFSGALNNLKGEEIEQWADEYRAERQAANARIADAGSPTDAADPNGSVYARLKWWRDKADQDADRIAELEGENFRLLARLNGEMERRMELEARAAT